MPPKKFSMPSITPLAVCSHIVPGPSRRALVARELQSTGRGPRGDCETELLRQSRQLRNDVHHRGAEACLLPHAGERHGIPRSVAACVNRRGIDDVPGA
jgi:hypothetical protein